MENNCIQFIMMITSIITTLITAIALIITIRNNNKQLRLNFFAEYTKRYQEIFLNFPGNINEENFRFEDLGTKEKDTTLRYLRAYFDLCSEEYFLWKNKNIEDKTWKEWESGIKNAFSKRAFIKGWELVNFDTIYYHDFTTFVKKILKENKKIK
jgi:hypothetical protein